MRKILDIMFENKKLSILIPMLVSVLLCLLFIILGVAEDKMNIIIVTLLGSVFWFLGVFFVLYIQIKNKRSSEGFLNFYELFATIAFSAYSVAEAVPFITSGFQNFSPLICVGLVTYAAVSWAHSKRT